MRQPSHPGALIAANLDALGLSTAEGAEALQVTRQQLHNVVTGRSAVSPEMALRLERAFGGEAEMWLKMQAAHDLARLRENNGLAGIRRLMPEPD